MEIVAAAAVPIVAGVDTPHLVPAVLGALVLVIEAVIHLNQYQQDWLVYRSTAESLKHEKFLYLARAGAYAGLDDARANALLAECVEMIVSREHAKWVSTRQELLEQRDGGASSEPSEAPRPGH